MSDQVGRRGRPNPCYVLLLLASAAFVLTTLGYLIGPSVQGRPESGPGSRALAAWLDRNGPRALGVELATMLVAGLLAMTTDRWFAPGRKPRANPAGPKARPRRVDDDDARAGRS